MPVTTKPSPSLVGTNHDQVIHAAREDLHYRLFEVTSRQCHSPWEHDPRRPGYRPKVKARRKRDRVASDPFRNHFQGLSLIASSIRGGGGGGDGGDGGGVAAVAPYENGFVNGLLRAFNQDQHLTLRPDDVWQAIISQFGLFVNGNAERLRHLFVQHEGKRTLAVDCTPLDLAKVDFDALADAFVTAIQANVVDPELQEWMLPAFSTTTDHDRTVAAFGVMGVLQQYFDYEYCVGCGLPSVTLLGERDDWAALAARIERLPRYGQECARWADLLRVVMRYFLLTFDAPDSPEVHDFWLRVAHQVGIEGSGMGLRSLSGWITAFIYFGENGKVNYDIPDEEATRRGLMPVESRKRLLLDGVSFPLLHASSIPRGVTILPMEILDLKAQMTRFTTVISGSIGMSLSAGGQSAQPASAWWIVEEFQEPM